MFQLLVFYMGSLILRSIGIAVIAGICSWKIRNVAMRHAVWVAVLGSMLLMPAADYLLPASWVPARIQRIAARQPVNIRVVSVRSTDAPPTVTPARAAVALPVQSKSVDLWVVAATMYALVAFAMFARLARGYWKLWKLRRTGTTIASPVWNEIVASHRKRWRMPVLFESEAVQVPMTVGFVRPAVILPADWKTWDDWKMTAVLLHEIAHVRRGDWGIAVIASAAKCAYWLNPLSWFLERKLSHLAEQACDDATLSETQNPTRYAEILLEFAVATQNGGRWMNGGVAMAHHKIQDRIERVLGKPQSGTGIVKAAGWTIVTFLAVPIMYSAAASQVKSETVKSPVPAYAAEFGRNLLPQVPTASQPAVSRLAPASVPKAQQISSNPAVDLPGPFQMELENRKIQWDYEALKQKLAQAQLAADQANSGPTPAKIAGSVAFLQEETYKAQLNVLQNEVALYERKIAQLQQQIGSQSNPDQSQLDQLRANKQTLDMFDAELTKINKLIEEIRLSRPSTEAAATNSKNRVFVTGRVQRSGDLQYDKPLTVLQALALAGGFQEYAKTDAISIIRVNGDSTTLLRFNYSDVIKGINSSQNIYLTNGDVVVVP